MTFTWDKTWEIGISDIDNQHKGLFDIINTFGQAIEDNKSSEVIGSVLKKLDDYTHSHFTFEESLMRRNGYEGIEIHKQLHTKFITELRAFHKEVTEGNLSVSGKIYNFLGDWLRSHIHGTDTLYAESFKEKGIVIK